MMTKRDVSIVLLTFCLTSAFFMMTSRTGADWPQPYDAWTDLNDDGRINYVDLGELLSQYGATGDPTKNVNVTNWPEWWPAGEVEVTNLPLDEQGNIMVNSTGSSVVVSSDFMIEAESKVWETSVGGGATAAIDIRPPPGEIWTMNFMGIEFSGEGTAYLRIYIVDNTTGGQVLVKDTGGAFARLSISSNAEFEAICTNDVYYRLECYYELAGRTVHFAYNGKRVK